MRISKPILVMAVALSMAFAHGGAKAESDQDEIGELKEILAEQARMIKELKAQVAHQSKEIKQLQAATTGREQEVGEIKAEKKPEFRDFFKRRELELGVQYRVMYNNSNLPTHGERRGRFEEPEDYDFFRQRFRISLDVKPTEKAGGFAQLEFRNAWGVGPQWHSHKF